MTQEDIEQFLRMPPPLWPARCGAFAMVWRVLLVVLKSSLAVALFEFLNPVAGAIGLQLTFVTTAAAAISRVTVMPYREAEVVFLLAVAVVMSQMVRILWDLITGWGV